MGIKTIYPQLKWNFKNSTFLIDETEMNHDYSEWYTIIHLTLTNLKVIR